MKYFSHIGQDAWVAACLQFKRGGFFLDFGAFDGQTISNTYTLEKDLGWKGICVEPNPRYYPLVCQCRNCISVNVALWPRSREQLRFVDAHGLSAIESFKDGDTNSNVRSQATLAVIEVDTLNPNELLARFNAPKLIDYLTLDVEGAEFDVLSTIDLKTYQIALMTIEHNHDTPRQEKIRQYLAQYGYEVVQNRNDDFFFHREHLTRLLDGKVVDPVAIFNTVYNTFQIAEPGGQKPAEPEPSVVAPAPAPPTPSKFAGLPSNTLRIEAEEFFCDGAWSEATARYKALVSRFPDEPFITQRYLECLQLQGFEVLAKLIRAEAVERHPEWANALNGQAAAAKGNSAPVEEPKKKVEPPADAAGELRADLSPELAESLRTAHAFFDQQAWLKAGALYAKLAVVLPDDLEICRGQLECNRQLNHKGLVKMVLDSALLRHPEWEEILSEPLGVDSPTAPANSSNGHQPLAKLNGASATAELPPAVLVLHSEEHPEDFLKLVKSKLSDRYPNGQLLCLIPENNHVLQGAVADLQTRHPRLNTLGVGPDWNHVRLQEVLKPHLAGQRAYWLTGNDKFFKHMKDPKPLRIQKEEGLEDFLDAEPVTITPAPYPQYVNIALTSVCNYKCFFCYREKAGSTPHMPLEHLKSLRKLIEETEQVDLTSPGESLIYPHIREAIEFITSTNRKKGIQLTTTGFLLTEELSILLSKRLSQLTFSVNAATPESYERDMGNKHWDKVLEHIRAARKHIPREKISLSYVLHRDNIDELPAFLHLAAELDVWHVRLVGMIAITPDNVRKTLWFCKERTKLAVQQAKELGKTLNIVVSDMYETVTGMSDEAKVKCVMPTFGAYVRLNGEVWPCCYSYPHVMGNIHEPGGFDAVWNGKKYRKLREHTYFDQCKTCPAIHPSMDVLDSHISSHVLTESKASLPLITVLVSNLTNPATLRTALASLKRQTYTVWEAVLVLDAKTETATRQAAQELAQKDSQVRCLEAAPDTTAESLTQQATASTRAKIHYWMEATSPFKPQQLEENLKDFEAAPNTGNAQSQPEPVAIPPQPKVIWTPIPLATETIQTWGVTDGNPIMAFRAEGPDAFAKIWQRHLQPRYDLQFDIIPAGKDSFELPGYCVICGRETRFMTDHMFSKRDPQGRMKLGWRERQVCACQFNARHRATYHVLRQLFPNAPGAAESPVIYCTEQKSELFKKIKQVYPHAFGSEYFGPNVPLGSVNEAGFRHEDITQLTLPDASVDGLFTIDVFEHVPNYQAGIAEMARCLRPGGKLLFTIPYYDIPLIPQKTVVRASFGQDGNLIHHLPPMYHCDPIDPKGALCFNDFGWDLLELLQQSGFADAALYFISDPAYGYVDLQYIFVATRN